MNRNIDGANIRCLHMSMISSRVCTVLDISFASHHPGSWNNVSWFCCDKMEMTVHRAVIKHRVSVDMLICSSNGPNKSTKMLSNFSIRPKVATEPNRIVINVRSSISQVVESHDYTFVMRLCCRAESRLPIIPRFPHLRDMCECVMNSKHDIECLEPNSQFRQQSRFIHSVTSPRPRTCHYRLELRTARL